MVRHGRAGRDDREAGEEGAGRPDQPEGDEDPIASEPLEEVPGQHADDDRRNHPDRSEQTGGEHAPEVEDEHEQDDRERAVGRDSQHPRDPETPDPVVRERLAKRGDGGSERARNRQTKPPSPDIGDPRTPSARRDVPPQVDASADRPG